MAITYLSWLALCTLRQQKEAQEGSEQISAQNYQNKTNLKQIPVLEINFLNKKSTLSL
jgi:hypothetical protein